MIMMQKQTLRTSSFTFKLKLDEKEILQMRDELRTNFSKIQTILRQVKLCMLLILRYFTY